LRQKFAEALLDGALAVEKVPRMIRLVMHAIRHVLQKESWEPAFKRTGMWSDQSALSSSIKRDLQYQGLPSIPSDRPTADLARPCWPKDRHSMQSSSCPSSRWRHLHRPLMLEVCLEHLRLQPQASFPTRLPHLDRPRRHRFQRRQLQLRSAGCAPRRLCRPRLYNNRISRQTARRKW